jgi:hypothetical protein
MSLHARPRVGGTRGSAWVTATQRGAIAEVGALPFFADPFWPLAALANSQGRRASFAVRPHVRECAGASAPRWPHERARGGHR